MVVTAVAVARRTIAIGFAAAGRGLLHTVAIDFTFVTAAVAFEQAFLSAGALAAFTAGSAATAATSATAPTATATRALAALTAYTRGAFDARNSRAFRRGGLWGCNRFTRHGACTGVPAGGQSDRGCSCVFLLR